nr:retrovirus-related Pol polyprotein from transposon TNT 1-94 [Tanacetum cinerariifolium]
MKVEESLNVTFNESPPPTKLSPLVDDDVGKEEAIRKNIKIEMLKKFGLEDSKPTKTSMSTLIKLTKDGEAESIDSSKYHGEITTLSNQMDYKRTKEYLPRIHRSRQMDEELTVGLKPFLTLNEPICPRFVVEFYHSLEVNRNELDIPYIEFKLGQFTFTLTPSRKQGESMHCIHALLPNHCKKVQLHFDDYLSNGRSHKETQRSHAFCHAFDPTTNPEAIVPIDRFTFHEYVMDPLDISRNPSKEKGMKIAFPLVISSFSSSSDENEGPSFLEFYDEFFDHEDLTQAQREKIGMFKCLNRYVGTIIKYLEKKL